VAYAASWFSWILTPGAWGRNWAYNNPDLGVRWLPPLLRSLVEYHRQVWSFHTGLDAAHPYQAGPIGWLIQWRPTFYFWGTPEEIAATPGCDRVTDCVMSITSLGNPLIWWLATISIVATIFIASRFRDWRGWAALSGIAFGWLPWFLYPERTTFTFYTIAFLPFMIFALCYVVSRLLHTKRGRIICLCLGIAILLVSAAFYPLWTATPVPRTWWHAMMWLPSWI
jgi:dolichyl-phosphate-mannose--protein O-mannosyl transferase